MDRRPQSTVAVVFDLDGTLIDSRADIAAAVNHALHLSGRAPLAQEVIGGFVGDGARWLVARAAALAFDDPAVDPLLATFLGYYTEHATDRTMLMPGAAEALTALSDVPLALCTNKPRPVTEAVLRHFDLEGAFSVVVAGGDLPFKKPAPEPLLFIASELRIPAASLIVIGDGPQDIEAAHAVGARSIAVAGGFSSSEALAAAGPTVLVDALPEAIAVVERFRENGSIQATRT